MNDEEAMCRGIQFSEDNLKIVEATFGSRTAMAYAGAVACGARNYVAERHGTKAAWDLMTGLADDILTIEFNAQNAGKRHG